MSALTGFRVVELAESVAGEYCGKLLADFGAEVIKIEAPGRGSRTRAMAPILADGPEGSALFAYLNTNKQSVILADEGVDQIIGCGRRDCRRPRSFLGRAVSGRGVLLDHPIRPGRTRRARKCQEHQRVPRKWLGVPHAQPCRPRAPAFAGTRTFPRRLRGRTRGGVVRGVGTVPASAHRPGRIHRHFATRGAGVARRLHPGQVHHRRGPAENNRDDYDQQGPASFFACADGFVYLYMTSRTHWLGVKTLMGQPEWLDSFDDDWLEFSVTPEKVAEFQRGFAAWVAGIAQRRRGRASAADGRAAGSGQRGRGSARLAAVPVTAASSATWLIPCWAPRRTPPCPTGSAHHRRRSAPLHPLSASTPRWCWIGSIPRTERRRWLAHNSSRPRMSRGGPLEGVRVVELTKVWAGPYAGKLLALLGAEVIKVETTALPEEMRAYGGTDINHAPYFLEHQPRNPQRGPRYQVTRGHGAAARVDRAQRHRPQQPSPGSDGATGPGIPATDGDQAGHHLGVDQDVGQRRTAGSSDRLRAVLRCPGRARVAGRLPGRASAGSEHALRGFHGRRGRRIRRRGGVAAS